MPIRPLPAAPVLRWIFERGHHTMTCEVRMTRSGACDVTLVPHWDLAASGAETFDGPAAALRRHAEIASRLRDEGWTVRDHVPVGRRAAA